MEKSQGYENRKSYFQTTAELLDEIDNSFAKRRRLRGYTNQTKTNRHKLKMCRNKSCHYTVKTQYNFSAVCYEIWECFEASGEIWN